MAVREVFQAQVASDTREGLLEKAAEEAAEYFGEVPHQVTTVHVGRLLDRAEVPFRYRGSVSFDALPRPGSRVVAGEVRENLRDASLLSDE